VRARSVSLNLTRLKISLKRTLLRTQDERDVDDDVFYCSFRNKTLLAAIYLFGLGIRFDIRLRLLLVQTQVGVFAEM
jgi:hypothetical protein